MPSPSDFISVNDNRLLDAMLLHTKQEVAYRMNNPAARRDDPVSRQLQLDHYRSVLDAFRKTKDLAPAERSTRRYLRHAIRRNKLRGRPLTYQLAYRSASWIVSTLLRRRSGVVRHRKELAAFEKGAAVEQNVHLLGDQLRRAGFNLVPEQALQQHLQHQLPRFDLRYSDPNHSKTDFVLHFKKLPGADAYFFAGFDAISRPTLQDVIKRNENNPKMAFSMIEGPAFTANEAAQLAAGRPIQKDVAGQPLWFRPNMPSPVGEHRPDFDLLRSVGELPIKEMKHAISRNNLLAALQSGEQREVTLQLPGGREEKALLSIAADLGGVQVHTKEGRYLDIADYTKRLTAAKLNQQQAQVRKLQPVQKNGRSRVAL